MEDMETFYSIIAISIFLIIFILGEDFFKRMRGIYKKNILYDKSNKDERFEKIYSNIDSQKFLEIEKIRKELKFKRILKNMTFTLILISCIIFNLNSEKLSRTMFLITYAIIYQLSMYALFFGIPLWISSAIKKSDRTKKYEKQYKNEILSSFVNFYNNEYVFKTEISEEENVNITSDYSDMKFSIGIVGDCGWVTIQNCIYGELEDATIMSVYDIELLGERKPKNDSQSMFKGTYIVLDIGRTIPTSVRITKNKLIPRKNKVELDSSEFEKYFDVNSEDKIFAARILTADVMQTLTEFYKKYNLTFEIVFKENKVHINLHTDGTFKIPVYRKMDKKQIYIYYAILEFATNLSKEINKALNQIEL